MERRFKMLFKISIQHDKYGTDPVSEFSIQPTMECRRMLARHNMLYKQDPRGGFVAIEELVENDGTMHPTRPFRSLTEFSFWIVQQDTNLLSATVPYDEASQFHVVSDVATSFLLCFDNVSNPVSGELAANGLYVSVTDAFPVYPPVISLNPPVTEYKAVPITPNAVPVIYKPQQPGESFTVQLTTGTYLEMKRTGIAAAVEKAVVTGGRVDSKAFGVVRIFKDEQTDYNTTGEFTISFKGS